MLAATPATAATLAPAVTPAPPFCAEQSQQFVVQTNKLLEDWDVAAALAAHSSRFQLPDQVYKLQALRGRAQALPSPACAAPVKALLVYGMDSAIQSLQNFAAHKAVDGSLPAMLPEALHDLDAARHAANAVLDASSWQPMTIEDIKRVLPQYTWVATTLKSGATAIEAGVPPVTIQVFHTNGVVYKIYVGAVMFDLAAYPAAWQTIAPTAVALLPYWHGADTWLAGFGATDPPGGEYAASESLGFTTVRGHHARYPDAGMEIAAVEIYIPRRAAPDE